MQLRRGVFAGLVWPRNAVFPRRLAHPRDSNSRRLHSDPYRGRLLFLCYIQLLEINRNFGKNLPAGGISEMGGGGPLSWGTPVTAKALVYWDVPLRRGPA